MFHKRRGGSGRLWLGSNLGDDASEIVWPVGPCMEMDLKLK